MRYLGNKSKLLHFIESVIDKYNINGDTFLDLFSGTASVGEYFKDRFKILSNDYMYFSSVISHAKLKNDEMPKFNKFIKEYSTDPFDYFNTRKYTYNKSFFISNNYTPKGERKYFTEANALKIDGIRIEIEELYKNDILSENEYYFLLASLLQSVLKVSNTTGTYQAFLKFWESRSLKELELVPIQLIEKNSKSNNEIFCANSNYLVRDIEADVVYIDPPYTINQYTNSYHILETIAKYDYPEIFGKTGRRKKREMSNYSNKSKVFIEFEDLFRQLRCKHVLISYSNQGILSIDDLVKLAKKFSKNYIVHLEEINYKEYATNNLSYKGKDEKLKEYIIYFEKDFEVRKSAINYSGSKDNIFIKLQKRLPKHIGTFVDMMGGAFNVGLNVVAMDEVHYIEKNPYIYKLIKFLIESNKENLKLNVNNIVSEFELSKKNKDSYLKFREAYNIDTNNMLLLYVLHVYSFQNIIRFNSKHKMNTPVGNNEFSEGIEYRLLHFYSKTGNIKLFNADCLEIEISSYPSDTIFYFDPPYFITNAEYNDGKRGFEGWTSYHETKLLNFLTEIDSRGYKFMLSNVIEHNKKVHKILIKWANTHGFNIFEIGETGIKYPRKEVLVTNYLWEDE